MPDNTKSISLNNKNNQLWQTYQTKKADNRMLFPTEGAQALSVSELELMLASPDSQYMGQQCKDVLLALEQFGKVESIVRNELAVHEKQGLYHNLQLGEKMGLAINVGGLDLRFFMWQWKHMIAVTNTSNPEKPSYSIQFYDAQGNAINKVYLRELTDENIQAWQNLVQQHVDAVTVSDIELQEIPAKTPWQYKQLNDGDKETLQKEWLAITDVHQFHFLLKKLELDRASSYRQAPENMTVPLSVDSIEQVFEKAKQKSCSIMIFVGNTGVVQIQTGQVHQPKRMGDWFNILDKAETQFTLHLKDKSLAQVWCIRRPTKDGIVTCIEGFDQYGESIITIFGERLEGQEELAAWREITAELIEEFTQPLA